MELCFIGYPRPVICNFYNGLISFFFSEVIVMLEPFGVYLMALSTIFMITCTISFASIFAREKFTLFLNRNYMIPLL